MMNILEEIVKYKRAEVQEARELYPVKLLEKSPYFKAAPVSLEKYLLRSDLSGIIAEFKRKSPSKGMINEYADPANVCLEYMQAGASALSVITDTQYFGGSARDLTTARRYNFCPILRKDFIVDEYQVIEARSMGADVILLIAEILTFQELKNLYELAASLQMEVLFEIHHRENISKLPADARIIGINNRNLENFEVNIAHSMQLLSLLPASTIKVAESGIDSPETALRLKEAGFAGLLMGERFMREADPGRACKLFIKGMRKLKAGAPQSQQVAP
jgi:indole-3-glycerol phosphate synthase